MNDTSIVEYKMSVSPVPVTVAGVSCCCCFDLS